MTTVTETKKVYLRVGHHYLKTIGMYAALGGRSFGWPVDVAWNSQGRLYVANRPAFLPRITILNFDEDYFGEFGGPRDGDGKIGAPAAVAIDRSDAIYVSDQLNHCIINYDPEGKFIARWGVYGSGKGELKEPSGMALDDEDSLYVVDSGNNRIQKFTSDGKLLLSWGAPGDGPSQFNIPHGVYVDSEGRVCVADRQNSRIQIFSSQGEFLDQWKEVWWPNSLCQDIQQNFYVAEIGGIFMFGHEARLEKPAARMTVRSPDGTIVSEWSAEDPYGKGRFFAPHSVALDSYGDIYVGEVTFSYSRHQAPSDAKVLRKYVRQ